MQRLASAPYTAAAKRIAVTTKQRCAELHRCCSEIYQEPLSLFFGGIHKVFGVVALPKILVSCRPALVSLVGVLLSFLHDKDVEELAKGGSMDETSTSKKSKGLLGDMSDVWGALSGGAHIVRREDGTL